MEEWIAREKTVLTPMIFVNFVGLAASFHSAYVMDKYAFKRVAIMCNWSMREFYVKNFVSMFCRCS